MGVMRSRHAAHKSAPGRSHPAHRVGAIASSAKVANRAAGLCIRSPWPAVPPISLRCIRKTLPRTMRRRVVVSYTAQWRVSYHHRSCAGSVATTRMPHRFGAVCSRHLRPYAASATDDDACAWQTSPPRSQRPPHAVPVPDERRARCARLVPRVPHARDAPSARVRPRHAACHHHRLGADALPGYLPMQPDRQPRAQRAFATVQQYACDGAACPRATPSKHPWRLPRCRA